MRQDEEKLTLRMSDKSEWNARGAHLEYFSILNSEFNVGKKFTFYTLDSVDNEPIRIEIED